MSGPESDLARAVLGALILKPDILEGSDVSAGDFPAGRFRETFAGISEQWENGRPDKIDDLLLTQRIGGDGARAFIASLINGNIRLDPETFRRRLHELRRGALRRRALADTAAALRTEEKTGIVDPEEAAKVRAAWQELEQLEKSSRKAFNPADVLKSGAEIQALDIHVHWTIPGVLPARAVNLLYGIGGIGKTWVEEQLGLAIAEGGEVFGRKATLRPVVFIDYENPLSVLVERARRLNIRNVQFWHSSFDPPPPRLDGDNFDTFLQLPADSVIFFDTLRAGYAGKENDSDVAAFIMGRMKKLRDAGFDPVILHHTPRANPQASKGSTAFTDLADHTLALYRVRRGTFEEIIDDGDPGPDALFRLGTGTKSRFEPGEVLLKRSPAGGFVLAEDPDLPLMAGIKEYIRTAAARPNQSHIKAWAEAALGINSKGKIVRLLNRGEGRFWQSKPEGKNNARVYETL